MSPKIIFLKVTTNQEKLFRLTKTIQEHFDLANPILILVPTDEVAQYIDQLIWRLPEESFIPHLITNDACNEYVVITTKHENINKASVLINLCQEISPTYPNFHTVYELYDQTHPSKEELSKQRYSNYQTQGVSSASLSFK